MATGFGAGYFPAAPGTAGSLVGLAVVFLLRDQSILLYALVFLILFALGVYAAGRVERASGEIDSRRIVIDEIAGMLVVGFLIPPGAGYLFGGFLLFRVLDIVKPFPADWVERRLTGGWAIMLDDLVAGLYANLILQGVKILLSSL